MCFYCSRRCTASSTYLRSSSSFFEGSGDHGDLHSFPTRRSSDLSAGRLDEQVRLDRLVHPRVHRVAEAAHHQRQPDEHRRSEEHTSELQSLRHLVCRLLLEKKKKTNAHLKSRFSVNTRTRRLDRS